MREQNRNAITQPVLYPHAHHRAGSASARRRRDQGPPWSPSLNKVSARSCPPVGRHAVILSGDTSSRDGRLRVQVFQHAIKAGSADAERLGDLRGQGWGQDDQGLPARITAGRRALDPAHRAFGVEPARICFATPAVVRSPIKVTTPGDPNVARSSLHQSRKPRGAQTISATRSAHIASKSIA